jgi:hypothetical protein
MDKRPLTWFQYPAHHIVVARDTNFSAFSFTPASQLRCVRLFHKGRFINKTATGVDRAMQWGLFALFFLIPSLAVDDEGMGMRMMELGGWVGRRQSDSADL